MKVGDLVQSWEGIMVVLERQPTPTVTGDYWWRVYNTTKERYQVVHECDFEVINASR